MLGRSRKVVAADFSRDWRMLRTQVLHGPRLALSAVARAAAVFRNHNVIVQSADGELLLWSIKDGGAGLVDGREGRDVQWATHTVTGDASGPRGCTAQHFSVGWHAQGLSSIPHRCSAAATPEDSAADAPFFAACASASSGNIFFHLQAHYPPFFRSQFSRNSNHRRPSTVSSSIHLHQPSTSQFLSAKTLLAPPHPPGHVAIDIAGKYSLGHRRQGALSCVSSGADGGRSQSHIFILLQRGVIFTAELMQECSGGVWM
jgi:hypothetical protein